MKKRKTAPVIRHRFNKINKALAKITVDFGSKDIHDFRVAFKKMRAFLRLAASDRATGGRLHHFYQIAGTIRNLQLQQQRIGEEWENKDHPPQSYLDMLSAEKPPPAGASPKPLLLRGGIALLQPYYLDRITDPQERAALEALKKKWEEEKERRKKELYDLLI